MKESHNRHFMTYLIVKKLKLPLDNTPLNVVFTSYITGINDKAQERYTAFSLVLFSCVKYFSSSFLKTQQIAAAWVATVRKRG